ncbi:MAG: GNAT family N-acetyltransferase [Alphaproteobacteria bacterium]|jgi:predicted N-acyltransferase|nr:GNAT family N-acetyltransferase [Alphaproteobacteria bacterium]
MDDTAFRLTANRGLADIEREAWDRVANPEGARYDPFLSWDFLEALERSGAAAPETGWSPLHLTVEGPGGELRAAMPLYAKTHSYGEFVFDHAWADAFERAGGDYYPKLLGAVPFTPVTGRRFLVPDGPDAVRLRKALRAGAVQLAEENGLSSLHLNFLSETDAAELEAAHMLMRTDQQFHFINEGYETFEDFLAALSSSKRKNLKKERRRAQEGLEIRHLTGSDITEADWDAFYVFYVDTGARKWGRPYLNRESFSLIGERMADQVLLVMAYEDGEPIAGAMNMIGSDTLYGRYWGCSVHRPMLHFEVCYYQAMDFALSRGLKYVEAGAQGGHKLARGYQPVTTRSAHWIAHPGLRQAVGDYLTRERAAVEAEKDYLRERTPFKKGE